MMMLLLALAALAGAATGLLAPQPADAACPTYCCPDAPTVCFTCCRPWQCGPNCP